MSNSLRPLSLEEAQEIAGSVASHLASGAIDGADLVSDRFAGLSSVDRRWVIDLAYHRLYNDLGTQLPPISGEHWRRQAAEAGRRRAIEGAWLALVFAAVFCLGWAWAGSLFRR